MFCYFFFFFNDTPTTEIYTYLHTLSLHDALPIFGEGLHLTEAPQRDLDGRDELGALEGLHQVGEGSGIPRLLDQIPLREGGEDEDGGDRKSTRLNSSH